MKGISWIHVQRPSFTPIVFLDPAGKTVYIPVYTMNPVIPKAPPAYHVVLDNNLLTL
ncbi:hypothetical protein [Sulfurisphaera ohwakuensis]|uniref:hypothetical protein n=1 Tax=Sulfurisphaera ohwakuensis TaxID=69656 RepID=UPI0036F292A2